MRIELTDRLDGARLVDVDILTEFAVTVPADMEASRVDAALRACGAGYTVGSDAMISASWVLRQVTPTQEWMRAFEAMLAYAGPRGWLSDDGASIRAHIARVSTA